MKQVISFSFLMSFFLITISGCGRVVDWAKSNVKQGSTIKHKKSNTKKYIKTSRIYDQFTLLGSFDTLWLSDAVRKEYVDLHAVKFGKTQEQKNIILRRQLEENNHFISFYILSVADILLGEKDSKWSVILSIKDQTYTPIELKVVELSPEYQRIFDKKNTIFKTAYLVRFNAKDIEDKLLLHNFVKKFSLIFRTLKKEIKQTWNNSHFMDKV